jgi:hypothetical protein
MDNWQPTFLGLKQLPRELTAFEIEAFFTFTLAERQVPARWRLRRRETHGLSNRHRGNRTGPEVL